MINLDPLARRSLLKMVLVALAVRLLFMGFTITGRLNPRRDHFAFGYETGRIARAIAAGQGFSSPLPELTGPTALMAPAYPYILAGIFKVFGIYTKASALAILTLQDLCSALTCLTIFLIGRRTLGTTVAARAGWAWAFFPSAIYISNRWIWETAFTALLLSLLFLMTLHLEDSTRLRTWLVFGLLWGLAALTNPSVLSIFPFLLAWLWWRCRRRGIPCGRLIGATLVIFILSVAPWFVRNYRTFGQWIFFRDNFGIVLRMGNNEDTRYPHSVRVLPTLNDEEMARFRRMGELAYMEEKRHDAVEFIVSHPWTFAWLTLKRIVYVWTGIWSLRPAYLMAAKSPLLELSYIAFCTLLSVLAFLGLRRALRSHGAEALPYLILLAVFPLVYYATNPQFRYRHPIDPQIVLLATYAVDKRSTNSASPALTEGADRDS